MYEIYMLLCLSTWLFIYTYVYFFHLILLSTRYFGKAIKYNNSCWCQQGEILSDTTKNIYEHVNFSSIFYLSVYFASVVTVLLCMWMLLCYATKKSLHACLPLPFQFFFAKKDKKEEDNDYVKAIAENREDLLVNGWYMWTTWEYFSSIAMILLWKMLSLFLKMVTMHGKIFHA